MLLLRPGENSCFSSWKPSRRVKKLCAHDRVLCCAASPFKIIKVDFKSVPFLPIQEKDQALFNLWNCHSRISTYLRTSCRSLTFTPGQIALGVHWWSSKLLPPSLGAPFLKQIVLVRFLAKKGFIYYLLIRVIQGKGYKNLLFLKWVQNIYSFTVEFLVQIGKSFAISRAFIPNGRQKTFSAFN